ncbi:hypothetical protein GUJ93_ZPchr0006g40604 [Zizania palustris]|uniref:Uncharacterized protein n=1 Tax=Zizania palustris TaxID=103762 RepID=A0A8J5SG29_ZIZPA|nr:hypothetical protein GUJ93_ZPchr0006g40604 [Zizania palustris]
MITRAKLVEQLREHQIRSAQSYSAALAVFSPSPHIASRGSKVDLERERGTPSGLLEDELAMATVRVMQSQCRGEGEEASCRFSALVIGLGLGSVGWSVGTTDNPFACPGLLLLYALRDGGPLTTIGWAPRSGREIGREERDSISLSC